MNDLEATGRRPAGKHVVAGFVAALLSLILHGAGVFYMADMRLNYIIAMNKERPRDDFKNMQLGEIFRNENGNKGASGMEKQKEISRLLGSDIQGTVEKIQLKPDEVTMEPPALSENGTEPGPPDIQTPEAVPVREKWQPPHEILVVESKVVSDPVRGLERKKIPRVERIRDAAQIAWSYDPTKIDVTAKISTPGVDVLSVGGTDHSVVPVQPSGGGSGNAGVNIGEKEAEGGQEVVAEKPEEVTEYKPIEDLLKARVTLYSGLGDFRSGYFRIEVDRIGEDVLPVIPKDIVFVQDSSASMAEQRLFFCRQALTNCITRLGPDDRFNVMSFRDKATFCFKDWAAGSAGNIEHAGRFIMNMKSTGSTDLLESIKKLKTLKRVPGRPVIAVLISDGRSNTGITKSSDIIGEFTKINKGDVSVFTIGTINIANTYLLDMLSYCNRGSTAIVDGGRWGIPDTINRMTSEVSRPVMADMDFRFPEASGCEVYPSLTSNLYLDRSFVLYGRYPLSLERIVFQALGKARDVKCDMIFDMDIKEQRRSRDKSIRLEWAKNKIYSLIGRYVSNPDPAILAEIKDTARQYDVEIPYQGKVESRE